MAGCNGDGDGHGHDDCYRSGTTHRNGKQWRAKQIYFQEEAGKYDKNKWHFVEAYFRLNSIVEGKGVADGVLRYWFDGELIMDHGDVLLRTSQHSNMKFNQFFFGPYIGDGSPVIEGQTFWIDEITLATQRPKYQPRLSIRKLGSQLVVSWPRQSHMSFVQSSWQPGGQWTTVDAPITGVQGTHLVQLPGTPSPQFFRLSRLP